MRHVQQCLVQILLWVGASTATAADIFIFNQDAPGEGFNDETVVNEDDGFPAGTTLGQKRMAVFQEAASIWAEKLQSNVHIRISARFDPLDCSAGSAILGTAGPGSIAANYPNLPHANTDYVIAAAEAISNQAILPNNEFQIVARFSSSIDNGCFAGGRWWYGTQQYPTSMSGRILLLPMILHELTHALGSSSFVCVGPSACGSTPVGGYSTGRLDAWAWRVADTSISRFWAGMTNAERATSITSQTNLVWDGPHVNAAIPIWAANGAGLRNGYLKLHAPSTASASSSVSHWTNDANVRLLMRPGNLGEQFLNVRETDMSDCLLKDIGWTVNTTHCALGVNQAPVFNDGISAFLVTEDQTAILRGFQIDDSDSGNSPVEMVFTATGGTLVDAGSIFPVTSFNSATMTYTGTVEALNNTFDSGRLQFVPTANIHGERVLTVTMSDLGRHGSGGPKTANKNYILAIQPVNDAPVFGGLFATNTARVLAESNVAHQIQYFDGMTLTDDALVGAPVRLHVTATTGSLDTLSDSSVQVAGTAQAKTLTGAPTAIVSYLNTQKLRWLMGDDPEFVGEVSFLLDDLGSGGSGGSLTDSSQVQIIVDRFNDPPTLSSPAMLDFQAGGSTPLLGIQVGDPDVRAGTMFLFATVSAGVVNTGPTGGLVTVSGNGTSSMQVTGTMANLNTYLAQGNLIFVSTAVPSLRSANLQLRIFDNGNTGDSGGQQFAELNVALFANSVFANGFE